MKNLQINVELNHCVVGKRREIIILSLKLSSLGIVNEMRALPLGNQVIITT